MVKVEICKDLNLILIRLNLAGKLYSQNQACIERKLYNTTRS